MHPQYTSADELELAYLAGAIDADGFISIRASDFHNHYSFNESVGLGQLSPIVPRLLQARFGGQVQVRIRRETEATNWRPLHCWVSTCRHAANACAALLPYLRLKGRQAELLLELRASKDRPRYETHTRVGIRSRCLHPDIVAYRRALRDEIRALNRVGRS